METAAVEEVLPARVLHGEPFRVSQFLLLEGLGNLHLRLLRLALFSAKSRLLRELLLLKLPHHQGVLPQ